MNTNHIDKLYDIADVLIGETWSQCFAYVIDKSCIDIVRELPEFRLYAAKALSECGSLERFSSYAKLVEFISKKMDEFIKIKTRGREIIFPDLGYMEGK